MIKEYFKVKSDCFCEGYIHEKTNYPRPGLIEKKLLKDDIVQLVKQWSNFYGTYLRVIKDEVEYDILPEYLERIFVIPKKIYICCTVRGATEEYKKKLEDYVTKLEQQTHIVHLPHRDTNQNATGIEICIENMNAIKTADEIHVFYNSKSQGSHFDLGMAFVLEKKIIVVENEIYGEGKSFPRMIDE